MLVLITCHIEEGVEKLKNWKTGLQRRGLNVNMAKKFRVLGVGLDKLKDSLLPWSESKLYQLFLCKH